MGSLYLPFPVKFSKRQDVGRYRNIKDPKIHDQSAFATPTNGR